MKFGGVSLFSIVLEALRLRVLKRRVGMSIGLASAIVLTLVVDIWWGALLVLLLAGSLLWRGQCRRLPSARQTDKVAVCPNNNAGPLRFPLIRPASITPILDRFESRHALGKETQLIKAGVLWHLYGDPHGARGHCLDLLGKMQPEDPLFAEVCDLFFSTCQTPADRTVRPVVPLSVDIFDTMPSTPVTHSGAKIIPFKSRDAGAASLH